MSWGKPRGFSARPQPGRSKAIARPISPDCSTSASQSSDEPGLPWTNNAACASSGGPASTIRVLKPPRPRLASRISPGATLLLPDGIDRSDLRAFEVPQPDGQEQANALEHHRPDR